LSFLDFKILDLIDILLTAFLLYQLYRLVKGTVAIRIFFGIASIFAIWKLVQALNMVMLSQILGSFIGLGVIVLIIVFQQEIRKFLLYLGSGSFSMTPSLVKGLVKNKKEEVRIDLKPIITACALLAET
jgi:DNA integrity scanning protein DisA with diadenylate cyclase activity